MSRTAGYTTVINREMLEYCQFTADGGANKFENPFLLLTLLLSIRIELSRILLSYHLETVVSFILA